MLDLENIITKAKTKFYDKYTTVGVVTIYDDNLNTMHLNAVAVQMMGLNLDESNVPNVALITDYINEGNLVIGPTDAEKIHNTLRYGSYRTVTIAKSNGRFRSKKMRDILCDFANDQGFGFQDGVIEFFFDKEVGDNVYTITLTPPVNDGKDVNIQLLDPDKAVMDESDVDVSQSRISDVRGMTIYDNSKVEVTGFKSYDTFTSRVEKTYPTKNYATLKTPSGDLENVPAQHLMLIAEDVEAKDPF